MVEVLGLVTSDVCKVDTGGGNSVIQVPTEGCAGSGRTWNRTQEADFLVLFSRQKEV
jgi:hypothetical protein